MTNTTAPYEADPIAPLGSALPFKENHQYRYSALPCAALLQVTVGHSFDREACPGCVDTLLLQFPVSLASAPGISKIISQWLKLWHPGWTYLASYNVTGSCCPVGGYSDANTPF